VDVGHWVYNRSTIASQSDHIDREDTLFDRWVFR
jgi:hypothetical protein